MTGTHTVKSAPVQLRTYDGAFGTMVVWGFDLDGLGQVELHKKKGNQPPGEGTSVLVESVQEGKYQGEPYKRVKLAAPERDRPRGRSPEETKAIQRQHSQEMALRLIDASGDAMELDLSNHEVAGTYLNGVVKRLTDWFEADIARSPS